jgi:hypothetical protein
LGVLVFCGGVFAVGHCRLLSAGHPGASEADFFSVKQRAAQPPRESRTIRQNKRLTEKTQNHHRKSREFLRAETINI